MSADSIDEVIAQLDARIARAEEAGSPAGYFAALYRKVTARVRTGIREGEFEDGPRMERLDVVFANRYLEAARALDEGRRPSESWHVAFEASRRWSPIVLQHLLLGMNAHINLDLGVAAAEAAPGAALPALRDDFNRINGILGSLMAGVKQDLTTIWPMMGVFDRALGTSEDVIANFSMEKARCAAWALAESLAPRQAGAREDAIRSADARVARFGRCLWRPGLFGQVPGVLVRVCERGSVRGKIRLLVS